MGYVPSRLRPHLLKLGQTSTKELFAKFPTITEKHKFSVSYSNFCQRIVGGDLTFAEGASILHQSDPTAKSAISLFEFSLANNPAITLELRQASLRGAQLTPPEKLFSRNSRSTQRRYGYPGFYTLLCSHDWYVRMLQHYQSQIGIFDLLNAKLDINRIHRFDEPFPAKSAPPLFASTTESLLP